MFRGRSFGCGRPPFPHFGGDHFHGRPGFHGGNIPMGPRGYPFRGNGRFPGPRGPPPPFNPMYGAPESLAGVDAACPTSGSGGMPQSGSQGHAAAGDRRGGSTNRGWHRGRGRGSHNQKSQNKGNKANNKKNKESAEKVDFHCDTCCRGYKNEEKYKEHIDQHVKCPVDKCPYVACQKLVKFHVDVQHQTGLAKKIWSLESKDDIQKWINERKKNYPTTENVEKKKATRGAQASRGEVLETKEFGKMRGRGRGRDRGRGRGRRGQFGGKRAWQHQEEDGIDAAVDNGVVPGGKRAKLDTSPQKTKMDTSPQKPVVKKHDPALDPLAYMLEEKKNSDNKTANSTISPLKLAGGLGSLISSYGDITDSEEEEPLETPMQVPVEAPVGDDEKYDETELSGSSQNKESARGESIEGPVKEVKSQSVQKQENTDSRQDHKEKACHFKEPWKNKKKNRGRHSEPPWQKMRQSTLLEKLLAPEIRHERNVILQCIRYIVNNDFFGVGQMVNKDITAEGSPAKEEEKSAMDSDNTPVASAVGKNVTDISDDDIWEVSGTTIPTCS